MSKQTVTVPTSLGPAEAIKDSREAPWVIGYPWTDEQFYGSITEVRAHMRKAIDAYEREASKHEQG